ncbi:MAG: tRNA uridine-5-carboxymethylaminomethyl(34) synthesis GTPase MnmE [Candidatus Omnitrophica bacterium]|nr:tRNA uridine-5-carboxymethylaminomethyl(34) synthesis GTPase MnmE [Candidatus Omnitrophota bacterium]
MRRDYIPDTIAAVSTPLGEGGIGIVRLSGGDSIKIADKIFLSKDGTRPSAFKSHTIHYGRIVRVGARDNKKARSNKETVDEVLLTVMKAPNTYTREDIVEINCHSGMVAIRKILDIVVRNGARVAEPGEFTKRAFLNGRLDLTQAEAVLDIIKAKTMAGLRVSLNQLSGSLSKEIKAIRDNILNTSAEIETSIDFPEEDIEPSERKSWIKHIGETRERLDKLAKTYYQGAMLKEGVVAVICGRANVGKSSLMNMLLKKDRVIVTHLPGTTRDAIEELININGIPIRLVDTAGFRRRKGLVEKAGMAKSRDYLAKADLIICVIDGAERLTKEDSDLLKDIKDRPMIVVLNKCDLRRLVKMRDIRSIIGTKDIILMSCLDKSGLATLENTIYNKILGGEVYTSDELLLGNIRHKDAVERAACSLRAAEEGINGNAAGECISSDINDAIRSLNEVIGEIYADDILDIIFSKFCIGK